MYTNWFIWIIFVDNPIGYINKSGVTRIIQSSQHIGELQLPRQQQGDYLVIPIYVSGGNFFNKYAVVQMEVL